MKSNNVLCGNEFIEYSYRTSVMNSLARLIWVFVLCSFIIPQVVAEESDMQIGMPAPAFSLPDQKGVQRTLADYRGHWVVLYFYPKDDTPGCTTEACHFRDDYFEIKKLGADILGVSVDSEKAMRLSQQNTACHFRCWQM